MAQTFTYTSSRAVRYDHGASFSPPQGTTFGTQSFGLTPQFRSSAISDVGSMSIGSMAVNMNVENVMNSDDKGWRSPLDLLRKYCALSAIVDSSERFDPPRCAETTRRAILQEVTDWANNDQNDKVPAELFWLHGGAGAGKSALAQTLSEAFQHDGKLAASFFFSRGTPLRSDGDKLIPTVTLQLTDAFPELSAFVEDQLNQNAILFSKSRQKLASELLFEPLLRLSLQDNFIQSRPRLIVIDGLDECADPDVQCDLLRIVARLVYHLPYPLRFFITSRPESHIVRIFDHDPELQSIQVLRYNLSTDSGATDDIRKFFTQEFQKIRTVHPLRHHLPADWGSEHIGILVQRSSGHFIYASTVIRYIQSPKHRPHDRLKVIVDLSAPPRKDQPYAQLDSLYAFIFSGVDEDDLQTVLCVFGLLHLRNQRKGILKKWMDKSDHEMVEAILNLQPGDVILFFDPLLSLVALNGEDIQVLHKSLIDYLLDANRSACFHLDLALAHEAVANYFLINYLLQPGYDRVSLKDFEYFCFHCRVSRLNERLRHYLINLDILYDKFIPLITQTFKFSRNHVMQLLSILKALRYLKRPDFDTHINRLFDVFKGMPCANCRALEEKEGRVLNSMFHHWQPPGLAPPGNTITEQEGQLLYEFIKLQLPSIPHFTWRTAMVSSLNFHHYYFYGSSHYGSRSYYGRIAFVTYGGSGQEIVLSSYQDTTKDVIISCAKKHLANAERAFGYTVVGVPSLHGSSFSRAY